MKAKRIVSNAVTTVVTIYAFSCWFRHVDREFAILKMELFKGWIGTTIGIVVLILLWLLLFFLLWIWDLLKKGGEKNEMGR